MYIWDEYPEFFRPYLTRIACDGTLPPSDPLRIPHSPRVSSRNAINAERFQPSPADMVVAEARPKFVFSCTDSMVPLIIDIVLIELG